MLKTFYPLSLKKTGQGYCVFSPDLDVAITRPTASEAAAEAKAAVVAMLPVYVAENGTLPEPTGVNEYQHHYVVGFTYAELVGFLGDELMPEWLEAKKPVKLRQYAFSN